MSDDLSVFSKPVIKKEVDSLRDFLSQSNIAFLLGAGCSYDAGLPLMSGLTEEVMNNQNLGKDTEEILSGLQTIYSGATQPTIEDYMSDIVDYLAITERRNRRSASEIKVEIEGVKYSSEQLSDGINEIKKAIVSVIESKDPKLENHQKFVRSVHRSLEAGKQARQVDYFVLNYDTLIEDALGIEKINFTDGFAGTATGWWDPSLYHENTYKARVQKIHGSIDWSRLEGDTLPRRIRKGTISDKDQSAVLIYPSAPKFREVQKDPFAQLLNNMRRVLRPEEREQVVLCVCGYSFQDAHINLEIKNALIESGGKLTLVVFIDEVQEDSVLAEWLGEHFINDQIRIYTNNEIFFKGKPKEFEDALSWWKFEVLAMLLGGER